MRSCIFILIFFSITNVFSNSNKTDSLKTILKNTKTKNEIANLKVQIGFEYYKGKEFVKSEKEYKDAYKIALEVKDTFVMIKSLLKVSQISRDRGAYDTALSISFEAAKLANIIGDDREEGSALYDIGAIYTKLYKSDKALEYIEKAIGKFEKIKEYRGIGNCFVVKSIIDRKKEEFDEAKKSLRLAIDNYTKVDYIKGLSYCSTNLGNLYVDIRNPHMAIKYMLEAIEYKKQVDDKIGLGIVYGNIGGQYIDIGEDETGVYYLNESIKIGEEIEGNETLMYAYQNLVDYYVKKGNYKSALDYSNKMMEMKELMFKENANRNTSALEKKFIAEKEVIDANSKIQLLEKENDIRQLRVILLVVVIALIIIFSILIFLKQKRILKTKKVIHQNEKELLESKNRIAEQELEKANLERTNLKNELQFKRQELLSFSAHLTSLSELENNIKDEIEKINNGDREHNRVVENVKKMIKNNHSKEGVSKLYERIESINESFHYKMNKKHDNLTKEDLRLASLLILDLSSKEIAEVLFITPKSVDMKRYRLRKKLGLAGNVDLFGYLSSL